MVDWRALGFDRVAMAQDGLVAQRMARSIVPDLAIVDLRMPHVDGLVFAEWVRTERLPTQIIFLSGYGDMETLRGAIRVSAVDFLDKPVSETALIAAVEAARNRITATRNETGPVELGNHLDDQLEVALHTDNIPSADVARLLDVAPQLASDRSWLCLRIVLKPAAAEVDRRLRLAALCDAVWIAVHAKAATACAAVVDDSVAVVVALSHGSPPIHETADMVLDAAGAAAGGRDAVAIAAGRPVDAVADVPRSWRDAVRTSEAVFIRGYGRLHLPRPADRPPRADLDIATLSTSAGRLEEAAARFDEPGVLTAIAALAADVRSCDGVSREATLKAILSATEPTARAVQRVVGYDEAAGRYHDTVWRMLTHSVTLDEAVGELAGWYRWCITAVRSERRYSHAVHKAVRLIEEDPSRRLSLGEVAAAAGVSPSYLSHVFREQTGRTYSDYLIRARLQCAAALLDERSMRVYEVAAAVGYPDYRHFERLFRRTYGMSPTTYSRRLDPGRKEVAP